MLPAGSGGHIEAVAGFGFVRESLRVHIAADPRSSCIDFRLRRNVARHQGNSLPHTGVVLAVRYGTDSHRHRFALDLSEGLGSTGLERVGYIANISGPRHFGRQCRYSTLH